MSSASSFWRSSSSSASLNKLAERTARSRLHGHAKRGSRSASRTCPRPLEQQLRNVRGRRARPDVRVRVGQRGRVFERLRFGRAVGTGEGLDEVTRTSSRSCLGVELDTERDRRAPLFARSEILGQLVGDLPGAKLDDAGVRLPPGRTPADDREISGPERRADVQASCARGGQRVGLLGEATHPGSVVGDRGDADERARLRGSRAAASRVLCCRSRAGVRRAARARAPASPEARWRVARRLPARVPTPRPHTRGCRGPRRARVRVRPEPSGPRIAAPALGRLL